MMPSSRPERKPGRALLAFYGDDFTGASENMAQYHRHGLKTFMFLDRPEPEEFAARADEHDVVGIAGIARSLAPEAMGQELEPVFQLFASTGFRMVQYKLCSTFDSSRAIGNLGVVAALARKLFPGCFLPVFAATPEFGRYTVFGHHFARFDHGVFRLDRHPSIARHPTTPMSESELGRVLEEQGAPAAGLVDLRALRSGVGKMREVLACERRRVDGPIVFDGFADDDCPLVAETIWRAGEKESVVVLSAQGFAHGFGRFMRQRPALPEPPVEALAPVERLLVVSGSATPLTASQIEAFSESGAALVRLRASNIIDPGAAESAIEAATKAASTALAAGRSACVFTAIGPGDEDTPVLRTTADRLRLTHSQLSERLGTALGKIVLRLVARHGLPRVAVAGGDTSSYALRSMQPRGLAVASGDYRASAHVFRLSGGLGVDGLEISLKGGQVGAEDIFVHLRDGRPATRVHGGSHATCW